jgi:hypothetical protein
MRRQRQLAFDPPPFDQAARAVSPGTIESIVKRILFVVSAIVLLSASSMAPCPGYGRRLENNM